MFARRNWQLALLLLGSLVCAANVRAQNDQSGDADGNAPPVVEEAPRRDPALRSARATFETFLSKASVGDWARAAECLDFSQEQPPSSPQTKATLAEYLKETIDRMELVRLDEIPNKEVAPPYDFPPDDPKAPIVVARHEPSGNWLFNAATVARIVDLYEQYKSRPKIAGLNWLEKLAKSISPTLLETQILLANYQWICLLILIFLGFLADMIARVILHQLSRAWFKFVRKEKEREGEPDLQRGVWRPVGLLVQALVWYGGTLVIGLPPTFRSILLLGVKFFAVVAAVWTSFRLIDVLAAFLARKAEKTDTRFDDLLVPLFSRSMKVFVVVIGVLVCAEAFNLPIMGMLTGLGIGGLAIGFAAKDAIANFFGSVTVLTDRPFEIGDWIVTGGVEGTVESVGFRSTRVRTFYNSLVTLPNSNLTTAVVDNMGKRRFRRIKTMLGVQYDTTPDQMEAFCEGIRELIRRHPYTRKDYYHVYFNEFSDSSLNILLYCFLECPDWSIELREKQRLYLDIMRLADKLGVSFAFPTRTLHMFQEQPTDADSPLDLSAPDRAGQRLAARIAGPLSSEDERPGPVQFSGPSDAD